MKAVVTVIPPFLAQAGLESTLLALQLNRHLLAETLTVETFLVSGRVMNLKKMARSTLVSSF